MHISDRDKYRLFNYIIYRHGREEETIGENTHIGMHIKKKSTRFPVVMVYLALQDFPWCSLKLA